MLNNNYVKVNHNEGNAVARGHHPILYVSPKTVKPFPPLTIQYVWWQVSDLEVSKSEELTLLNFQDRDSQDPVTFGSSICL